MSFLAFGYTCNAIILSKATLKRILKRFKVHLSHKSNYTDIVDVALFVLKEFEKLGSAPWILVDASEMPRDTVFSVYDV